MRIETMGKPEGCKLLRVSVELSDPAGSDSLIGWISVRGDFFAVPEEGFEALENPCREYGSRHVPKFSRPRPGSWKSKPWASRARRSNL